LETGGRHIRPCLIHRDLYSGNVSVETATGHQYCTVLLAFMRITSISKKWPMSIHRTHIDRGTCTMAPARHKIGKLSWRPTLGTSQYPHLKSNRMTGMHFIICRYCTTISWLHEQPVQAIGFERCSNLPWRYWIWRIVSIS
jgi:hypothetical protein